MEDLQNIGDSANGHVRGLGERNHHLPAGKLGDRIESLREVALALLSKVDSLEESAISGKRLEVNLHEEVRRYEVGLILQALQRTQGHQVRAARLLGTKVTTLNSKIKRYGICPDEFGIDAAIG